MGGSMWGGGQMQGTYVKSNLQRSKANLFLVNLVSDSQPRGMSTLQN